MMTFSFLNCFFFFTFPTVYFYGQKYFYGHKIQKNRYGKHIAKNKKTCFENFILKNPMSYFLHDLLSFCVLGMGKRAFSKGYSFAPPT